MSVRVLVPGDEEALTAFLARHADSSMILRSNLRAAGVVDRGQTLQATYAAAFAGDDDQRIVAVCAHAWNGMVVVQAPVHLDEVVARAVLASGRAVAGMVGPRGQCLAARALLGMNERETRLDSDEDLYALDLAELRAPADLAAGKVQVRVPRDKSDLATLARWRHDYHVEALGAARGEPLLRAAIEEVHTITERGRLWALVAEDHLVAMTAFNAALPDMVQVGGVFTPPAERGKGRGRAVVAGSLLDARARGVTRAVLFTGRDNLGAISAYRALGFRVVGDYGLILFRE